MTITRERIELFIKNPLEHGLTRGEQMELAHIAMVSLDSGPVAMTTLTRHRLLRIRQWRKMYGENRDVVLPTEEADELARIALASLDAEPVAWTSEEALSEVYCDETGMIGPKYIVGDVPLYRRAQPAPVVPDECPTELLAFCEQVIDSRITANAKADELWNACRAAMLQGGEPVSQTYELPELIEGMEVSIDVSTCDADAGNRYFGTVTEVSELDIAKNGYILLVQDAEPNFDVNGNSPVIPGGWVMVPKKLTAENGAKSLLSGEFLETTFISCPECFADEECESCDGSGRIKIEVPVSWTTIKAIWNKGVEHFRSSTATGDN
ncbi:hypothetical protein S740_004164 [Salmonella enterica subsp. enterica]|nr:hypothetical protein [Salmonella enterica subsp. enterica]